ncbi:MAG: restriction endonuclease subunit S [Desulfurococcales archaeon]|nr:restriction endonuclease subunit S [Desulfurococcales archaeon]
MPAKTLDEYLKQTINTTTKQHATKQKYKITGFYKETQFQETPIGKIPKEWKIVSINDIFKVETGTTPSTKVKEYWENGTINWITPQDLSKLKGRIRISVSERKITEFALKETHLTLLPQGSIIVSTRAPVGYVAVLERPATFNQGCKGLVPRRRETVVSEYYAYFLIKIKPILEAKSGGSTFKELSKRALESTYVPLPPLEEQWGIAEVLSSVDEAIEAMERLIGRLERLKRGLMQELLTKGIGHKEYKQTPIGKIPKEWQIVKLQNITIKSIGGGTPSTKNPRYWNGDIPWMTSVGIPEDDIYITKGERFITEEGLRNSATNIIPKDNLIVATRVGLGKAGVNLIDIAINQDLVGLILDKKQIMPEFLAYYLRSPKSLTYIMAAARGTTIKGISRQALFNIRIPLPPLNEQQKIVNILITLDKWIKLEKKRKEKLERLKKGLMNLLLSGRIRVKVEMVSPG